MPWSETAPGLSAVALVPGLILLAYAVLGAPLLGWWLYRWLERRRESQAGALHRFYVITVAIQLLWIVLIAVVVAVSAELGPADLGLRLPHDWLPIAAGVLGLGAALGAIWLIDQARSRSRRGVPDETVEPGAEVTSALAPRSRAERRIALVAGITTSVGEELLYRAFIVVLLVSLGLAWWAAAVLAVVLFALAHVYQGWWGLVGPGLFGALLMVLYLGTGSLLVPILVHLGVELWNLARAGRGRRHRSRGR